MTRTLGSTGLAIGGVSSPLDSFVVNQTLVLINFYGKNPPLRQAAKRFEKCSEKSKNKKKPLEN